MNPAPPQSIAWQRHILSSLAAKSPGTSPFDPTLRAFVSKADSPHAHGSVAVVGAGPGRKDVWLAILLGPVPTDAMAREACPLPTHLIDSALAVWDRLPPGIAHAETLHQEISHLGASLSQSLTADVDHRRWWLVPLGEFRWVQHLIHEHGTPPPEVLQDWDTQFRDKPSPSPWAVVSPTGWVIDWLEMVCALRSDSGIAPDVDLAPCIASLDMPIARVDWPPPQRPNPMPDGTPVPDTASSTTTTYPSRENAWLCEAISEAAKKPATPRRTRTSRHTSRWLGLAAFASLVGILACAILLRGAQRSSSPNPSQAAYRSATPDDAVSRDDAVSKDESDPTDLMDRSEDVVALEASRIETIDEQEIPLPTLDAVGGRSLANTLAGLTAMAGPEVQVLSAEPPPSDGNEPADGNEPGDPQADPADALNPSARSVSETVGLSTWGTREDIRFGRGAHAKNGSCDARLMLETEKNDWLIQPSETQRIDGNGMCEWRIAMRDEGAELVVRLVSKPAARWQYMVVVGARTAATNDLVAIAPGEPRMILTRLSAHARWLDEALDAMNAAVPMPRIPGMPDAASYSRWLRAQQRDTARAIRQWTAVGALCDVLQASGTIELELAIARPTQEP